MSTDWHGRDRVDLGTELHDRQVIDPDGVAVGKVDDLELRRRPDGRLEVAALLIGTEALIKRLPVWGRLLVRAGARIGGGPSPLRRVEIADVTHVNARLTLSRNGAEGARSRAAERIGQMVAKVPGSGHASG